MFSIIDRYIAKNFLLYFLASLVVFITLFLAIDIMSFLADYDVPMAITAKYFALQIPLILYQMIPVACLIATVFTVSSLNSSGELVALFASGMSLARISTPILVLVSFLSAISFWMSDQVIPRVTQKKNYIYYVEIKKTPSMYSTVKTNKIWYRSANILFNIQTLNAKESKAQGINLYYFDDQWQLVQKTSAKEVSFNARNWLLTNGVVTLFEEDSDFPMTRVFETKNIVMDENLVDIQQTPQMSQALTVKQLRRFISKNKASGLNTAEYEIDLYSKFSFAFAAVVMSLMGLPFSVKHQRSGGKMANTGMCLGLIFVYWAMYSSFLSMGKFGTLSPFISAWAANILLLIGAITLLVRTKR